MNTVLLIKIVGILGVGAVAGWAVHSQLKKNEETKKYASVGGVLAAVLAAALFAAYKFYSGNI